MVSRLLVGTAISLAVVLVYAGSESAAVFDPGHEGRPSCPAMPVRIPPAEIHLEPGLLQHQNWIDFDVPARFAGFYAFCLDDRVMSAGGGLLDFHEGRARFHLATRSVDLYWLLSGSLEPLREVNRWELRLECSRDFACR